MNLTWVEFSKSAFLHNLEVFNKLAGPNVVLAPNVKGNAYGHGLVECASILEEAGTDYLCVNSPFEVEILRKAGIKTPILMVGYTPLSDLKKMIDLKADLVVYNLETLHKLIELKKPVNIHLKIETGNHRQGIEISDLRDWISDLKLYSFLKIKGVSTHFANLEDRIHHQYALLQLNKFKAAVQILKIEGIQPEYQHCANSAALLMLPEAHFNFARPGIGIYGLWPSEKTKIAAERLHGKIELKPVMSWKTIIAQVKQVKKGALIGYGCTYEMKQSGKIAVLPVGYYDGYSRHHSNKGYVLIHGKKAPVIGRICMNMMMVDVTDIPKIRIEDEVVLIGRQGTEEITAEMLAEWSGTINYEVTTRINEKIPRIFS